MNITTVTLEDLIGTVDTRRPNHIVPNGSHIALCGFHTTTGPVSGSPPCEACRVIATKLNIPWRSLS